MKVNTSKDIITTLNYAIKISKGDLDRARFLVVACKHALQAHALEFAKQRLEYDGMFTLQETKKIQ